MSVEIWVVLSDQASVAMHNIACCTTVTSAWFFLR